MDVCLLGMLCLQLNLSCRVLRAYDRKWQVCRAFLMCSIFLCNVCLENARDIIITLALLTFWQTHVFWWTSTQYQLYNHTGQQ